MHRFSFSLLLVSLLASCGGPPKGAENPPPKLDLKVERGVYLAGNDGVEIAIAELAGGEEALVRVTGIRTPIEGKVIRHKIEHDGGSGTAYVQTYRGRTRYTVRHETRYGRSTWRAYIPGHRGIKVAFDKEKSAKLDTAALVKAHARQLQSGELAELQRFDRQAVQRKAEQKLSRSAQRAADACGTKLPLKVDWGSLTDEQLKKYSVSGYCDNLPWQIKNLCRYEAGKRFFGAIKELGCAFGGATSIVRTGAAIKLTVAPKTVNLHEKVRAALKAMKASSGRTLAQEVTLEKTDVCLDPKGKQRVVIVAPREAPYSGVSYGDGKTFFRHKPLRYLGGGWFSDPRQINKRHNRSIRGYNLRFYSYVRAKRKEGSCKLVCGTRETKLKLASREKAVQIVTQATFKDPPHKRVPYALARDRRGTYYYVDRGSTEQTKRDFHLYIGRRGKMRKQVMKDIISDSEGEVFSSRKGKLRLILGKASALWIKRKSKKKLLWVPVNDNLNMIYNELGVYFGVRLGVPCDDY